MPFKLTKITSFAWIAVTNLVLALTWSHTATAQYPEVHEEPYHKPLYEWDCFRYLNVRATPGDTTAYHIHRNPILYLTIEGAEVWLDDIGKVPRVLPIRGGWVGSNTYGEGDTLLHRFAVRGSSLLRIVAVERTGQCRHVLHPSVDPFYNLDGFSVYAIDWDTYIDRGYYRTVPAIVPPFPIKRAEWMRYSAGYLFKPVGEDADYMPAPGVEVLWLVLPSRQ